MIRICLDAGHFGKYNQSPVVPAYYESEMNWELHILLKAELISYGFLVTATRKEQGKDLDLVARGKRAKGCDLLLSLHSNGAVRQSADHVVIFTPVADERTDTDEKSLALAKALAPVVSEVMEVTEKDYRIAGVRSENDRDGDGVKNDNYYGILHGARMVNVPALIVEHSFHTNRRAAEWLLREENLKKLAEAEAKTIADFYGMKKRLYRVQVGAYTKKDNAEKMRQRLLAAGYDGFITMKGDYYKVQVGAYENKDNATRLAEKLKESGFSVYVY